MFDKLIDVLLQFVQLFQIYTFVDQYERGVILRCGKFHRMAGPGLRWILPLGFEQILTENVMPESRMFGIQSLHTSDGYAVNIQVAIVFHVEDEQHFLLNVEGPKDILSVSCAGVVSNRIQASTWCEISDPEFATSLLPKMNRHAKKCGCRITEVHVQDCSAGSAKKLWHEGINLSS